MKCLITGASSGIGKSIAIYMDELGYDLILVSRRENRLENLKKSLKGNTKIIPLDLSIKENVYKLYEKVKKDNIDILINNAGFGLFGEFSKTSLDTELKMIDLNIRTYHILTKLFLQDFIKKDKGYILNVASSAGFLAGPNLSTYYATKNYVAKLSMAIYEELKHINSNVHISVLCPGPVNTQFNKVAHGKFNIKEANKEKVARFAVDKMFAKKLLIVPGLSMKIGLFLNRFIPWKLSLIITSKINNEKS